jgi:hypothetical protein
MYWFFIASIISCAYYIVGERVFIFSSIVRHYCRLVAIV